MRSLFRSLKLSNDEVDKEWSESLFSIRTFFPPIEKGFRLGFKI